jgi:uncharacterized integral membrane protein
MKPKFIFGIIIGVLFSIILLQNTQIVSFKFLFWEFSMSRIILLPLVMAIGVIIGFFIGRKSWDW